MTKMGLALERGAHFLKFVFFVIVYSFCKINVPPRRGGACLVLWLVPWWPPGSLLGAPGAQKPPQGLGAHFEARFQIAAADGQPNEHKIAKHEANTGSMPSVLKRRLRKPMSNTGFGVILVKFWCHNSSCVFIFGYRSRRGT